MEVNKPLFMSRNLELNWYLVCVHVHSMVHFVFQDGHEICFVGDEAFRELSQVDPQADKLLDEVGTYIMMMQSCKECNFA